MKVRIVQAFTGYPDGKTPVAYRVGQEADVPENFGKLIVGKRHASEVPVAAAAAAAGAQPVINKQG